MTQKSSIKSVRELKALVAEDEDFLRPIVQIAVQEFLEAEMNEALGAGKGERNSERLGCRSGYYPRKLLTRVGTLELRVPQDRAGRFSTEIFERYQRSEKALVAALVEMDVQGVSTRKVKAISEELCGHEFSASTISELHSKLDAELERFARQALEGEYPHLILDARYEKVREEGVIRSRAARPSTFPRLSPPPPRCWWPSASTGKAAAASSASNSPGARAPRAGATSCSGSRRAACAACAPPSATTTPGSSAPSPKCSRKPPGSAATSTSCAMRSTTSRARPATTASPELRWLSDLRNASEAQLHLRAWLEKWAAKHPKLCAWVEESIEETWTFYRSPREHHKHLKSTNLLERLNQELKRRTHVVRIFPNEASCLRLIRALACEQHEEWLDGPVYLDMQPLREALKPSLKLAA